MTAVLKVKKLTSFKERSKGLIGAHSPTPVYFKTRWGIHTFFMKYPLDIVIADNSFNVIKIKEHLKPNRIYIWNPKFFNVFELPIGTIEKEKIAIGATITMSSEM